MLSNADLHGTAPCCCRGHTFVRGGGAHTRSSAHALIHCVWCLPPRAVNRAIACAVHSMQPLQRVSGSGGAPAPEAPGSSMRSISSARPHVSAYGRRCPFIAPAPAAAPLLPLHLAARQARTVRHKAGSAAGEAPTADAESAPAAPPAAAPELDPDALLDALYGEAEAAATAGPGSAAAAASASTIATGGEGGQQQQGGGGRQQQQQQRAPKQPRQQQRRRERQPPRIPQPPPPFTKEGYAPPQIITGPELPEDLAGSWGGAVDRGAAASRGVVIGGL